MVFDFIEKKLGKERPTTIPTKKSNCLWYYKQAIRLGDLKAAERYLRQYFEVYGGRPQDIRSSIKRAHPLAGLGKARIAFEKSLTPGQIKTIKKALAWYRKAYSPEKFVPLSRAINQ